ncbi:unnamed protein product [Somion occarium]|uniref:Uncharacterized protein n=1 Tax=Somion occarium TaxID=3059160 RepID=A0ABP1CP82_9APHY
MACTPVVIFHATFRKTCREASFNRIFTAAMSTARVKIRSSSEPSRSLVTQSPERSSASGLTSPSHLWTMFKRAVTTSFTAIVGDDSKCRGEGMNRDFEPQDANFASPWLSYANTLENVVYETPCDNQVEVEDDQSSSFSLETCDQYCASTHTPCPL